VGSKIITKEDINTDGDDKLLPTAAGDKQDQIKANTLYNYFIYVHTMICIYLNYRLVGLGVFFIFDLS
jgi:hypothetical protein